MKKIVFTYHRVGSTYSDYNNTCVSQVNFEQQILYMKTHFKIVTMETFLQYTGDELVATITFDDGYKDTVKNVLPIIEKYNVPITIFVTMNERDNDEFWMSDVMRLIFDGEFENDFLSFEIDGEKIYLDVRDISDRYHAYFFLRRLFSEHSKEFRRSVLEELHRQTKIEWKSRIEFCPLCAEDILRLAKNDLVTIGAHTVEHVSLAKFPEKTQRIDIEQSLKKIQNATGEKVKYFAYPFGNVEDVNEVTTKILRENGIVAAFTTNSKIVDETDSELLLPRINCVNDSVDVWVKNIKCHLGTVVNDTSQFFCGIKTKDENIRNANKIVICGCGRKLEEIIAFLKRIGKQDNIVAVVDNDKNKQKQIVGSYLISAYEEYYNDKENHWIICNRYDYEIFVQLRANSVDKIHWWID